MTSPRRAPPPPADPLATFQDACAEVAAAPLLHKGELAGVALDALLKLARDFDDRLGRLEAWRDQ